MHTGSVDVGLYRTQEAPLSTFCLVVLKVLKVDHLQLKANVRAVAELDSASGEWSNQAVNP